MTTSLIPSRSLRAVPVLLASLAWCPLSSADPVPKVCVVVVGDPDEAARAAAETLADTVGTDPSLRGVADSEARSTLRGERPTPEGMAELATARRGLRGGDRDGPALESLAQQFGCALVVEVASRPAGTMLQVYDAVHHTWQEAHEVNTVDASLVERWIVPAAHPPVPTALPDGAPTGPAPGTHAATSATPTPGATAAAGLTGTPGVPASRPSTLTRLWPWIAAGGAALAVVVVFLALQQQDPSSGTVRLSVVHQGTP